MSAKPLESDRAANPQRGEASIEVDGRTLLLRPSFAALVAAEEEFGPLFALVERAGAGELRLAEMAGLFWHCLCDQNAVSRERICQSVVEAGLAASTKPLRILLGQILQGSQ